MSPEQDKKESVPKYIIVKLEEKQKTERQRKILKASREESRLSSKEWHLK